MQIICDTNILLFWADRKDRLSAKALSTLETGRINKSLACSAISFWEIAMLFRKNRLALPTSYTVNAYMDDIIDSLDLTILPLTPAIAALAESGFVEHGDPGDRLIAATAMIHQAPLMTADEKLRATIGLSCIW